MAVPEALKKLREEFVGLAAQSAKARYSREAHHLTDAQLGVRCAQLAVSRRRFAREAVEAGASGISPVPAHKLLLVQDMEAQANAFEAERFARTARPQLAVAA